MTRLPPTESPTVAAIWRAYEAREALEPPREHLGASQIGAPCERALWYAFRWVLRPTFTGRMLALFERGKEEEAKVVDKLRLAGCTVHAVNPATGKQFSYSELGGHYAGSMDGAVLGLREAPRTWHVLEIKTHNVKSFAKLQAQGVQRAKPQHYAQMQVYMGWAELDRAAYVAVSKNDDDIIIERVSFDKAEFARLRERAKRIITATAPPLRYTDAETCRWCNYAGVCNGTCRATVNCRTCQHSAPISEGEGAQWRCSTGEYGRCDDGCHVFIPELIPAHLVGKGEEFNVYQDAKGLPYANVSATAFPAIDGPSYKSEDLP
jgi:radical SAM protein with 4Fe4S-binding SPASM domain